MIKKSTLLLTLILLISSLAQGAGLGFGSFTFSRDTLGFDDTLNITAEIINYDTAVYYAPVDFGYKINGVQNVSASIFNASVSGQLVSIQPHDSVPVSIKVVVTPDYFEVGPDILVVWPIAFTGGNPNNVIEQQIYIPDPSGINNIAIQDEQLSVYYAEQNIYISARKANIYLNQVRVFNLAGEEIINRSETNLETIPFSNESAGIYFIEVRFNDEQRKVFKLVKF